MDLTIIGKGGFAREVYTCMKSTSQTRWKSFSWYENEEILQIPPYSQAIILIANPNVRQAIAEKIKLLSLRYQIINIPNAGFSHPEIGEGTVVCEQCILTTNISIGNHCQFNIQTSIGHDCKIGDFVTTAPKVSISGNVTIGNRVYIGTGAIIKEKTYICDDVIIGAGAVVLNDITEPGTYVGIPAKKIK